MFINGLNHDLSLLVKKTRMEWETVCTPDLVNLANELSPTLDDLSQRKTTRILNHQLQQMKAPKWNQNPPSFCYHCKEPGQWKRDCYKFKHFSHVYSPNQPFQRPPYSQWYGSEKLQELFPNFLLNRFRETFLQIRDESLSVLMDIRATLSVLSPTAVMQPLPQSTEAVQIVQMNFKMFLPRILFLFF